VKVVFNNIALVIHKCDDDNQCAWLRMYVKISYIHNCCSLLIISSIKVHDCSGVPRNFVRGGRGFNKFSGGQSERGSGGGSPLVRGSGGSCNLVQEISFNMVKFS
jgi:hypothetical protein